MKIFPIDTILVLEYLACSWINDVTDCYIVHSTSLDSTYVLLDTTKEYSIVNNNGMELEDQMVSVDFEGIQSESESLGRQCFVEVDDEELAEISNEMV